MACANQATSHYVNQLRLVCFFYHIFIVHKKVHSSSNSNSFSDKRPRLVYWRIYASLGLNVLTHSFWPSDTILRGTYLSTLPQAGGKRQAIVWINADLLSIRPLTKIPWLLDQNRKYFPKENLFEDVVCGIAAILLRPQCFQLPRLIQQLNFVAAIRWHEAIWLPKGRIINVLFKDYRIAYHTLRYTRIG